MPKEKTNTLEERASFLLLLVTTDVKDLVHGAMTPHEAHRVQQKARSELSTILRKEFLAEKPTVAAGGYRGG